MHLHSALLGVTLVVVTAALSQDQTGKPATFAEAKADMRSAPATAQPVLLDYIAQREVAAGNADADADLQQAFALALRLPPGSPGKAGVEFDAVDTLLEKGELPAAFDLAARADANRGLILDRAATEALAAGNEAEGWRLLEKAGGATGEYPFHAAAALACRSSGAPDAPQSRALTRAAQAAGRVTALPAAARAVDFLEACAKLLAPGVRTASAVAVARRLPAPAGNLEIARLRQRLTAIAAEALGDARAAEATAPLAPPRPRFAPRPAGREGAATGTRPPATRAPSSPGPAEFFAVAAEQAMATNYGDALTRAAKLLRADPALSEALPLATARLALAYFEAKKDEDAQITAERALAAAVAALAGFDPLAAKPWPSDAVAAFALIAQMNPDMAATQARAAPPLVRPLLLAAVARAAAVPPVALGKPMIVLH